MTKYSFAHKDIAFEFGSWLSADEITGGKSKFDETVEIIRLERDTKIT